MIFTSTVKSKFFAVLGLLCSAVGVWAQSSTFTYQGRFSSNGVPVTSAFDFRFSLHDAATLGNPVGSPLTNAPLSVSNGLFTVALDFGAGVFDGNARWLEIGVRTNGSTNAYSTLTPRQLITATPYAVRAANFNGPVPAANLTGTIPDARLSPNVALLNTNVTFAGSVTATQFNGNGAGLTSLPATNLTGTVADARLSTNVAFLNTSNAVFKGAITATNFYGNGYGLTNVPGRIGQTFAIGANVQAAATYGYLATNDTTAVVVTLPPTAAIDVGATIRVSGSGAAGWIIAQNAGQTILMGSLVKVTGGAWRAVPGSTLQWRAAAASGDGQRLVAAVNPGLIYTSANYGSTWGSGGVSANWTTVAASGNGAYMFAAASPGIIYYSINGGAWTGSSSPSRNWSGVATSTDGKFGLACVNGEYLYRSINFGVSWGATLSDVTRSWTGAASSGDGVNLAACAIGANIYVSTNSGASWSPRGPSLPWSCIAGSADGGTFVAGVNGGNLYVSYDSGLSWIPTAFSQPWTSVSCSGDGTKMIASHGTASGAIYVSQDSGSSWQLRGNLTSADFKGAAVSGDGSTAIAVGTATPIYVSSQSSTTAGTTGQLIGARLSTVELQHVGNGVFIPISYVGNIRAK